MAYRGRLFSVYNDITTTEIHRKHQELRKFFRDKLDFELEDTVYFHDGVRKIDYICASKRRKTSDELDMLSLYLLHLEKKGVQYEFENGITVPEVIFIKLHAPEKNLRQIAHIHKVALDCENDHFSESKKINRFFATAIHRPDLYPDVFNRSQDILTYKRPENVTTAERSLCIYKILKSANYEESRTGIEGLIKNGVLLTAYPIHDGTARWSDTGTLTERQLLAKFWARGPLFYKKQPIFLIHKYYGAEMGFYFAFMGIYNEMLIYAAMAGLICFVYGLLKAFSINDGQIFLNGVCSSNKTICVAYASKTCGRFVPLKQYCQTTMFSIMFDNNLTVAFSIFLTFWSTLTMEMWKRIQSKLQYKWNLYNCEDTARIRSDFGRHTKYRRRSEVDDELEPYIPDRIKVYNFCFTTFCLSMLVIIVMIAVFIIIEYRLVIAPAVNSSEIYFLKNNFVLFVLSTSAIMNLIFIKLFEICYTKIAIYLTEKENPRTLSEYHDSIVYKSYILAFVNFYSPFLHTAFIKGKLYDYPGIKHSTRGMFADLCYPTGCQWALCVQLIFILSLRSYAGKAVRYTKPLIIAMFKKLLRSKKDPPPTFNLPQWEADYKLLELRRFYLVKDYNEVCIQYGLVILFASAFPLSPLLALINNVIELRLSANKYVNYSRRPVPRRLPGIGAWNRVLILATHIGTITSACLIAFNTEFIPRELFRLKTGSIAGLTEFCLSKFRISDYPDDYGSRCAPAGLTECYYRGMRYPPGHIREYRLTVDYWEVIMYKLIFVVAYEHSIWFLTALFAYMIPDIPEKVKKQLQHESDVAHKIMLSKWKKPVFNAENQRHI